MIHKCLSGLSALADKTRIFLTKSKDKLCHDEFLSRFLHPLKISKLSNFVSAWSAHETSWQSLPLDSIPVSRIHRTSFQSFQILEFRDKRKLMPFRGIFSEFNNKLVVAFYDKWRWKLSLLSLSHILLFALDAKKILLLHFRCPLKCSDV